MVTPKLVSQFFTIDLGAGNNAADFAKVITNAVDEVTLDENGNPVNTDVPVYASVQGTLDQIKALTSTSGRGDQINIELTEDIEVSDYAAVAENIEPVFDLLDTATALTTEAGNGGGGIVAKARSVTKHFGETF